MLPRSSKNLVGLPFFRLRAVFSICNELRKAHISQTSIANCLSPLSYSNYTLKPVRTPVAIFGSLGVCIYVPASRHWLISYSPIHIT